MLAQEPFQVAEKEVGGSSHCFPLTTSQPAAGREAWGSWDFQLASHKSHLTTEFVSSVPLLSVVQSHNKTPASQCFGSSAEDHQRELPRSLGLGPPDPAKGSMEKGSQWL